MLEVGKIVNTHGLRGEVKVVPWTDTPEVFETLEHVFVETKKGEEELTIRSVKYQKNNIIVKFAQLNDINEAENYKNLVMKAERESLGELPEGTYYITDLLGLTVEEEDGRVLGTISDVFPTGSNDVYAVKRENHKDLLIPVIDEVVLNIDLEAKKVVVRLMEGLEEL